MVPQVWKFRPGKATSPNCTVPSTHYHESGRPILTAQDRGPHRQVYVSGVIERLGWESNHPTENSMSTTNPIRVQLPYHLRNLARVDSEVTLEVLAPVTLRATLDALEARYPMLQGTIRDHVTQQRRPFLRFFACEEDLSHDSPDAPLPDAVVSGKEPLLIIGAIAGG